MSSTIYSTMKLFQSQIWNQATCIRYFSKDIAFARNQAISRRTILKKLYGPVIRNVTCKDDTYKFDPRTSLNKFKSTRNDLASEMFWRTRRKKNVRVFSSTSTTTSTSPPPPPPPPPSTHSIENTPNDTGNAAPKKTKKTKCMVSSARNVLRNCISLERNPSETIPFDKAGLKSITKYSLVCPKATRTQINEALENKLPSISKILTATMPEASRFALKKWKLGKIAELGEDGFREYEQLTLKTGQLFHSSIENYFENQQQPDESSPVYKLWQSVSGVMVGLDPKPLLIEQALVHPDLKYRGIVDGVAMIKDTICALEWKTSEKLKPRLTSTYDAPIQLCAYLGALNIDPRHSIIAQNGYVVIAYKDGTKGNALYLSEKDVQKYWSAWLKRVHEFWIRTRDGTLPEPI